MATIVTRSGKVSPLSHGELDANFTNLNNDKAETNATNAELDVLDMSTSGSTSGQVLTSTGTGSLPSWQSIEQTVLQVKSSTKTDTYSVLTSTNISTWPDVPDLSVTITPSSTTSKILVLFNLNMSGSNRYSAAVLYRDSTQIAVGDSSAKSEVTVSSQSNDSSTNDSYVMHNSSMSFEDSPNTTSSITYKIKVGSTYSNAYYTYINRPHQFANAASIHVGISNITVIEVKG